MNTAPQEPRNASCEMSQVEVARILGCSKANVFKIEQRALRKLRRALEERGYKASDFIDVSE